MPAAAEMLVEPPFERSSAPDDFQSAPDQKRHDHFIREAVDTIIKEAVYKVRVISIANNALKLPLFY
ncbi:hypothetical protein LSTR_LSTR017636 [Laodelphax striatellus]|uniref:Uncharacterized protein n=1 Tax=Laodelphax striatellus TaxID=195883 RepID=A0A482WHL2_LAOST|nr:hypothetical protein LSTR_LSTR017636 [Laodelphax striatellus]